MQNLRLQEVFHNDKFRFFQQQAFDGNKRLRKWAVLLVAVLLLYETLMSQVILPQEVMISQSKSGFLCMGLFAVALVSYYISIFRFAERMSKKIYIIRYILMWIAVMGLSFGLAILSYEETLDRVEYNNVERWFYSLIMKPNAVWVILLTEILVPIWYVKVIVPSAYWMVNVVAYYHFDLKYKLMILICFLFSVCFTALLWGIKRYHEWKVFEDRLNIEAWDNVHKYILDKVPDAIAVIDSKVNIIYSNTAFKSLCENNLQTLSQRLIHCRNSGSNLTFEGNDEVRTPRPPYGDETEVSCSFSEILEKNITPLTQGPYKTEKYLTFNAKLSNIESNKTFQSYEIKLGSLPEYNKMILILSDTTQRDLAFSLETANQYKDKLLATVSHDLRAPINGSMSLIESSIEHQAVPDFIKEQFLIPAQRSCKFLLHLANDILDFSQINAQKLRMNFEPSSLAETIKGCYQLLEMQANKKKIDFKLVLDENLPKIFTTDHNRLSQVIINLLTNAIKFTFSGSVTLSAQVMESIIQVKVQDTGIGIKDKDKDKLFQEFTRIEYEQRSINSRGVGLGLVIANRLAQALGPGHKENGIRLWSAYGEGSTFQFILEDKRNIDNNKEQRKSILLQGRTRPNLSISGFTSPEEDFLSSKIDEGDLSRLRSPYISIQGSFSTRRHLLSHDISFLTPSASPKANKKQFAGRVLVVDDDAINIIAFELIMKQYGVTIDTAYNGKEALDKVIRNQEHNVDSTIIQKSETSKKQTFSKSYQIIFMDCEMPIMNGFDATKALRTMIQNKKIENIPIIGCTGHQGKDIKEECFVSGMTDVITKPPVKDKLLEILEKYLHPLY